MHSNEQMIEIHNLGPIKNIKLPIKQFNFLIGEQATGKSTICKAIYAFDRIRSQIEALLYRLYSSSEQSIASFNLRKRLNEKDNRNIIEDILGFSYYKPQDLSLIYHITSEKSINISVRKAINTPYIDISFNQLMEDKLSELVKKHRQLALNLNKSDNFDFLMEERSHAFDAIKEDVSKIFENNEKTYYIPAGRSILSLFAGQSAVLDMNSIDLISKEYIKRIELLRHDLSNGLLSYARAFLQENIDENVTKETNKIDKYIKGKYINRNGVDYLQIGDVMIPMNHASSGQQEVMWIFNELFLILLKKEKAFIILEEPEAHIYPRLQLELVKFIAYVVNETGSTIFITTHSPYILTSLNLLCYAGVVAEGKNDTTAVSKLLDGNVLIKPGNVVSVKLEQRGGETIAESLLDDNEELKTEMIDGVSNTINELYTSLYDLEEK